MVVAETVAAAADAAEQIVVEYRDLPAVMTAEQALVAGAPLVHEQSYAGSSDESFAAMAATPTDGPPQLDNVVHEVTLAWGDVDSAMATAHLVTEAQMHYPMIYGYAMEPYNAVAWFSGAALRVVSCAQHPYMVRTDLARIFALPLSQVRVEVPYIGGGYGTKSYTKVEPLAAVGCLGDRAAGQTGPRRRGGHLHDARGLGRHHGPDRVRCRRTDRRPRVRPGARLRGVRRQQPAGVGQGGEPLVRSLRRSAPAGPWPLCLHQHHAGLQPAGVRRPARRSGRREHSGPGRRGIGDRPGGDQDAQPGWPPRGAHPGQTRSGRRPARRPGSDRRVPAGRRVACRWTRHRRRPHRLGCRCVPDLHGDGADPDRRFGRPAHRIDRDGPGQPVGTLPDRRRGAGSRPRPDPRRAVRHRCRRLRTHHRGQPHHHACRPGGPACVPGCQGQADGDGGGKRWTASRATLSRRPAFWCFRMGPRWDTAPW